MEIGERASGKLPSPVSYRHPVLGNLLVWKPEATGPSGVARDPL